MRHARSNRSHRVQVEVASQVRMSDARGMEEQGSSQRTRRNHDGSSPYRERARRKPLSGQQDAGDPRNPPLADLDSLNPRPHQESRPVPRRGGQVGAQP